MKRFLRYLAYRQLYRSIRKLMENAGDSQSQSSSSTSPSRSSGTGSTAEELLNNPKIPADGETVDSPAQLQAVLQQMDPYEFEHFVADLWTKMGWETEVSTAAGDKGVDVTARKSVPYDQLLLIQAKRYGPNTTVGSPDVQQYASLRHQFEHVDKVLIVTTNEFTQQARETANNLNVKLINGYELVELIGEHEALDLVAEYLDFIEPAEDVKDDEHRPVYAEGASATSTTPDATGDTQVETGPSTKTSGSNDAVSEASVTSTAWQKLVWVGALGWIAVIASVNVDAISDLVWGLLFFGSWLGLPIAIFLDIRAIGESTDWPRYGWAYVLGSAVWAVSVLVAGVYLWQRKKAVS